MALARRCGHAGAKDRPFGDEACGGQRCGVGARRRARAGALARATRWTRAYFVFSKPRQTRLVLGIVSRPPEPRSGPRRLPEYISVGIRWYRLLHFDFESLTV